MSTAKISFVPISVPGEGGSTILGRPVYYEAVTYSSSVGTTTGALAAPQEAGRTTIALIVLDSDANVAWGTAPNPAAAAPSGTATTAGLPWVAGLPLPVVIAVGDKIAIKEV